MTLQIIIIGIYFALVIVLGLLSRNKTKVAEDFFLAGRKGSTLFITGSLLATVIGGSAVMVSTRLGFIQGLTGLWWLLAGSIGLAVLGLFLAKKVRTGGLYSLPGLIEKQYGRRTALAGSVLVVIAWTGVIAAQIIAAGSIMDALGIGDARLWSVIFSFVFILYTVIGGQYAIIRTDSFQAGIIVFGVVISAVLVLVKAGGPAGLAEALPADRFAFPLGPQFGGYELVKYLLVVGLTYVVGPDIYSRLFCAGDAGIARKSALWTAGLMVPVALSLVVIGMGAAALYPESAAGQAFPTVIREVLPSAVGGIVLAALLCAFMSSADTTLMTAGTILSLDIVGGLRPGFDEKKLLAVSKGGIVVIGLVSLGLALYLQNIIDAVLFAYTVYTGGLIVPILAGFYREKLRVTPGGAIAAVIGGGTAALLAKLFDIRYLDVIALGISAALLFGVSFVENRFRQKLNTDY